MPRDPLAVLLRLRQRAVEQASRELMLARAALRQDETRLQDHLHLMLREQSGAVGDEVAAFAAWWGRARSQERELRGAMLEAEARANRLQETLTACRLEAEAAAKALERSKAAAATVRARREQAAMDEAGGRRVDAGY